MWSHGYLSSDGCVVAQERALESERGCLVAPGKAAPRTSLDRSMLEYSRPTEGSGSRRYFPRFRTVIHEQAIGRNGSPAA
jgi:hypothetical protein